eukprot:gene25226-5286_t
MRRRSSRRAASPPLLLAAALLTAPEWRAGRPDPHVAVDTAKEMGFVGRKVYRSVSQGGDIS